VLAKVAGETVYLADALEGMPGGLSEKDSISYVKEYLSGRINDILVYDMAVRNIPQTKEIDKMVENYRRSLMIYEYQQRVLNEKLQSEVSEDELKAFYEQNAQRFTSDQHLIKGLFLKVPVSAPNIDKLRNWTRNPDAEALQKVESYSVQYATIYNYFMDQWTNLDDILATASGFTGKESELLSKNHTFESSDDDFYYILYVDDSVEKGDTAPFEYIRPVVVNVMLNTRKTEFIRQFEQDLRKKASDEGRLTIYKN